MTILYVILGGAVGGALGWLFDRLSRRHVTPAAEDASPRT
jgi:lipoprotein signal peptidase